MTLTAELVEAPVVSAECDEPEGVITRHVYFMPLSPNNLRNLWEKARQFDTLFTEEIRGNFKKFLEVFLRQSVNGVETNGLFWVVDDFVGVFYMNNIIPDLEADVHYSFFDRRHRGRLELVRKMISYGFQRYGFQRMTVWIPVYATRHTFKFITDLGFKDEGKKRKAALYKGKLFDVVLFGILRQEALADRLMGGNGER